jgi:hypothetical protein
VSKPAPAIAPASPAKTEPSAPPGENASSNAIDPSTAPKDRLPVATTEPAAEDTREALAQTPTPAQTAVLAQQPQSNNPIYLVAAVALLLVALTSCGAIAAFGIPRQPHLLPLEKGKVIPIDRETIPARQHLRRAPEHRYASRSQIVFK